MAEVKNVLIFGGNGLVGKSFINLFSHLDQYKVFSTSRNPIDEQIACDITKDSDIENCFNIVQPSIVINCTNLAGGVNFCESNVELSKAFHFEANKSIGLKAKEAGAQYVLISTDYVFDGSKPPYQEDDSTHPLNAYGNHKLQAEQWIQKNLNDYIIARTTNVFGWDPKTKTPNFLMQLYFNLKEGKTTKAPSFLKGNPTYVNDLTEAIYTLLLNRNSGVFHVVGSSNINRYEWALKFCQVLQLDSSLIEELNTVPEGIVPRPLVSNLNTNKLKQTIGKHLSSVDEGLNMFSLDMKANEPK